MYNFIIHLRVQFNLHILLSLGYFTMFDWQEFYFSKKSSHYHQVLELSPSLV